MKRADPCLRQFAGACVESLRKGRRRYYTQKLAVLREGNPQLYALFDQVIRRFSFAGTHDLDELYLSATLFLGGIWPVPEIDAVTAQEITGALFVDRTCRTAILANGEAYLVALFPNVYSAYCRFTEGLSGSDRTFARDSRCIAQVIAAAVQRQLSNRAIPREVNELGIIVG